MNHLKAEHMQVDLAKLDIAKREKNPLWKKKKEKAE